MNKNTLLALMLASLLAACSQKTEAPAPAPAAIAAPTPPPPVEDLRIEKAKNAVLGSLKDPGSAQFKDVMGSEVNGDFSVCGKINAKNAMGGYVGFKNFCWTEKNGLMGISGG
jgi:hypothetical protein